MINGLSLIGAGTDSCIVDSRSFPLTNNRTITMKDSCFVKGFYIRTSNNLDYGYGIYTIGQTGLVTENKFSNANTGISIQNSNISAYKNYSFNIRTGIMIYNSNSIVRKNDIFTLNETLGDGIYIIADNSSYRPVIDSNCIETKDIGIYKGPGTRSTIRNNEIKLVNGNDGIFLHSYGSDSACVLNNKIYSINGTNGVDNLLTYLTFNNNFLSGDYYYDILYIGPPNKVKNNIINDASGDITIWNGYYGAVFQYNDVWNSNINYNNMIPDTTNLSVDLMIVNDDSTQGDLDYHLQKYSPLIDTGDPNILDKDSTRSDIGLYGGPYGESYVYLDLPPRTPVNLTANIDSLIKLNWNRNTEADFSYYNVYRDTAFNFTIDSTKLIASITDTFYYDTFPSNVETLYYKLTAMDNQGNESNPSEQVAVTLVSVKNEWKPVNNYILYQNYPNPFNPSTRIGYKLKERGYVKLYVYDIKGELVSVLVNQTQEAGYYEVEFSAEVGSGQSAVSKSLATGVYIYQIFVKGENNIPVFSDIKKMIYIK
jgi:hypothetical protein